MSLRAVSKIVLALVVPGVLFLSAARAESVVITTASPIEKLDAGGQPEGVRMGVIGTTYSLLKPEGDSLLLQGSDGSTYLIPVTATNYSPPPSPPSSPPAAGAAPTVSAPDLAAGTAPAPSPVDFSGLTPADAAKIKQINDALGLPLLVDTQFWQDNVDQIAARLNWPLESQTTTQESYRRYAIEKQAVILGCPAYSMALYGKNGKPTYLSIVFANAGDFPETRKLATSDDPELAAQVMQHLAAAVKEDGTTITGILTPLLGEPSTTLFGNSASNRDEVHRWDWNDVAFILSTHNGEYASIRIIPTAAADDFGTVAVTDRDEMRGILAQRVVHRPNGDVVLSEIPMVDQGPKGYCVPATWERYLRYMDVPADLYVLAILGQTQVRGTNPDLMRAGVDDYVSAYHRRIDTADGPLEMKTVSRYIDRGLPLMWDCWIDRPVEIQCIKNTIARATVTDWTAYADTLRAQDAALGQGVGPNSEKSNGHERLIIGYNATTNEIAISDSWGSRFAERWLYLPTAVKISQGKLVYLSW